MLSRVADSLYWMSRYLERAEHCARVIDVNLNLMLDQAKLSTAERWVRVAASLGCKVPEPDAVDSHELMQKLALDASNGSSIVGCIIAARENARQVREQISSEMWERLNKLFHDVKRPGILEVWNNQPIEFLQEVREGAYLFQGVTDTTMSHGEGWQFIQVGRYIERSSAAALLLDVHFGEFGDMANWSGAYLEWIGLLKSHTAFEAYCKVYTADLSPHRIAEFLLLNGEFPHSVRFAVDHLSCALEVISAASPARKAERVHKLSGRLRAQLSFQPIEEILEGGLHSFLEGIQRQCNQIHAALHQIYIAYPIQTAIEA